MKTIKIMSDGNQAKVGMICAYIENKHPLRIEIGVITHIKNGTQYCSTSYGVEEHDVYFKPIKPTFAWPYPIHYANLTDLSKATPEQKKLYWTELEKQTIQFRPEFEAKLKELGIRDQFVNNLFDPKWNDKSLTKDYKQRCINTEDWNEFFVYAFNWYKSKEGYNYWSDISFE